MEPVNDFAAIAVVTKFFLYVAFIGILFYAFSKKPRIK